MGLNNSNEQVLPEDLKQKLLQHSMEESDVLAYARKDIGKEGNLAEEWVVLTKKVLWTEEKETYQIDKVEELKCERLVTGGVLVIKIEGEEYLACHFSNSCYGEFSRLIRVFRAIKNGKELTRQESREDERNLICPKCHRRYEDPIKKVCYGCIDKKAIFKRLFSYLLNYKLSIFLILICMFLSSLLNMVIPYLTGNVFFDQILGAPKIEFEKVIWCILLMLGVKVVATGIGIIYGRINAEFSSKVVYDIKNEIFTALQKLSLSFYNNKQTGGLMNNVNGDATQLQNFFHDQAPFFVVNSITMIGILLIMFKLEWRLTLLTLSPIPIVIWALYNLFPKMSLSYTRRFKKASAVNSIINDSLNGVRVVKAFGKEEEEIERFNKASKGLYDVNIAQGNLIETAYPLIQFLMGLSSLVIWGYGGWLVVCGEMTVGTLISFTGYIGMLLGPLQFMTRITQMWSECMNAAARIFEIMDTVPEITQSEQPVSMPEIKGDVTLENVSFEYEPNKPVLHNINVEVKSGEMIGLVGHSGAGKSTLTNIITRLYDVQEGEIRIDGVPIKEINLRDLHAQIGIVLQETSLFIGTLAENIAYAKPNATREEIINAAKIANAHDFISKLPDGYDTKVGARGHSLSGGEKQRIAIARAILLDPKILILDEATASLDTETEKLIQEALERLVKGRTTFAIAHRLSTLRNADRLMVVERGKIEEIGTHEELIKQKGIYYKLVRKQQEALKLQGVS